MLILLYKYSDNSATSPVRIYHLKDREQAEKDLALLLEHGSCDKSWYLQEVELYNNN